MLPPATVQAVLADQIDVRGKGLGIAVGLASAAGRQFVSHGAVARGGPEPDASVSFELASMTKVFTGVLLADMARTGKVHLDDPVAKHLPAAYGAPTWNGQPITLLHLATHTSGLPPQPPDAPTLADPRLPSYSLDQLFGTFANLRLTRPVGSTWEYGNWDFALLGHALAHRAGLDFETLVEQRITGPLGMTNTALERTASMRLTTSHTADLEPTPRLALGAIAPAGGMVSSANDMLTLASALLGLTASPLAGLLQTMVSTRRPIRPGLGRMLRENWRLMLRMILAPPKVPGGAPRYFSDAQSGLAWFVFTKGRREMYVHDGAGPGCSASLAIDSDARTAVVVLSNTGINIHDLSRHLLWNDYPLSRTRREVPLEADVRDRYAGTYQIPGGPALIIKPGANRLTMAFPVFGDLMLRAESRHDFFVPETDFEIHFATEGPVHEMIFRPGRGQPAMPVPRIAG